MDPAFRSPAEVLEDLRAAVAARSSGALGELSFALRVAMDGSLDAARLPLRKMWRLSLMMLFTVSCSDCPLAPTLTSTKGHPGYRFIVPEGFEGCIEIELGVDGGQLFPRRDGFAVVDVKERGQRFRTAEPEEQPFERMVDEVWVRSDAGLRETNETPNGGSEESPGGPFTSIVCFGGADRLSR